MFFEYRVTYRGSVIADLSFANEPSNADLLEGLGDLGLMPAHVEDEDVTFPADEFGNIRVVGYEGSEYETTYYTLEVV